MANPGEELYNKMNEFVGKFNQLAGKLELSKTLDHLRSTAAGMQNTIENLYTSIGTISSKSSLGTADVEAFTKAISDVSKQFKLTAAGFGENDKMKEVLDLIGMAPEQFSGMQKSVEELFNQLKNASGDARKKIIEDFLKSTRSWDNFLKYNSKFSNIVGSLSPTSLSATKSMATAIKNIASVLPASLAGGLTTLAGKALPVVGTAMLIFDIWQRIMKAMYAGAGTYLSLIGPSSFKNSAQMKNTVIEMNGALARSVNAILDAGVSLESLQKTFTSFSRNTGIALKPTIDAMGAGIVGSLIKASAGFTRLGTVLGKTEEDMGQLMSTMVTSFRTSFGQIGRNNSILLEKFGALINVSGELGVAWDQFIDASSKAMEGFSLFPNAFESFIMSSTKLAGSMKQLSKDKALPAYIQNLFSMTEKAPQLGKAITATLAQMGQGISSVTLLGFRGGVKPGADLGSTLSGIMETNNNPIMRSVELIRGYANAVRGSSDGTKDSIATLVTTILAKGGADEQATKAAVLAAMTESGQVKSFDQITKEGGATSESMKSFARELAILKDPFRLIIEILQKMGMVLGAWSMSGVPTKVFGMGGGSALPITAPTTGSRWRGADRDRSASIGAKNYDSAAQMLSRGE